MTVGDPFDLVGDDGVGAVLVHGFTGSPHDMRYLGEQLARAGISVSAPRLPGHGTTLAECEGSTWREWVGAVERAVETMAARCGAVSLVGLSLGGLLALEVASRRKTVACVASLAAPLWLGGVASRVARWTRPDGVLRAVRHLPKLGGSDVRDKSARHHSPSHRAIPTRALAEVVEFSAVAAAALPSITQPVLVLHARHDHTAPVACAARIAELTRAVRLRILPRSYHVITIDVERDIVAAEVTNFIRRHGTHKGMSCAM